jgi:hypothetical protein
MYLGNFDIGKDLLEAYEDGYAKGLKDAMEGGAEVCNRRTSITFENADGGYIGTYYTTDLQKALENLKKDNPTQQAKYFRISFISFGKVATSELISL